MIIPISLLIGGSFHNFMKKYLYAVGIIVFVLVSIFFSGFSFAKPGEDVRGNKRVVAHSREDAERAVQSGCALVRKVKDLHALVCRKETADVLSFEEDVRVFAIDAGANTQIKADLVQAAGNTGAGRKVVVIDTGYNYLHPELSSSFLGGKDFVNNDDDPMDDNRHGSHVAGIITADGINAQAKGVAPGTGVLAAKVLDAAGAGYFSDVVAGIYWAIDGPDGIADTADDFHPDAINLSIGTAQPSVYKGFCDSTLPDLTAAIKHAVESGTVVVVAAGNEGRAGVSLPGCISYSTTVGAVDSADKIASFSGQGKAVDIVAPGVNIFSSVLGSAYQSLNGTSMATPMVAGVVALVKSAHPAYSPASVENALFTSAKRLGRIGKDSTYGWGRVNAQGAVK